MAHAHRSNANVVLSSCVLRADRWVRSTRGSRSRGDVEGDGGEAADEEEDDARQQQSRGGAAQRGDGDGAGGKAAKVSGRRGGGRPARRAAAARRVQEVLDRSTIEGERRTAAAGAQLTRLPESRSPYTVFRFRSHTLD